ncbi:benzoyl-CoA reductase subunit A [candidate division KSB1 bacterium]|nr:benzoyl-CoA reductase subunit A [candidate division KSB1 bacterium]
MIVYLGIDLGSTTSKAIILDPTGEIIGRGITNTRSDYNVAAEIARMEAEFNSRFSLLRRRVEADGGSPVEWARIFDLLDSRFHFLQYLSRHERLATAMTDSIKHDSSRADLAERLQAALQQTLEAIRTRFFDGQVNSTSQFFRDLFSATFMRMIDKFDRLTFDRLVSVYDRSINPVENQIISFDFAELTERSLELMPAETGIVWPLIRKYLREVAAISLDPTDYIGTGYGRQLLPFEEKHIKSEILCHALGAHDYFPETRTVLDIGGQDTKAIQVDEHGLVTSFQMNDRCAAGCGRYLGYIADEMSISVSELGPLAMAADHETNICSTCTVFAGAELREHLNLGERKENVLAGLHLAIVQRAFALLARSGGARNEFTFTGGVARNAAVVKYVSNMTRTNYGELTINLHPDSIFMGALGAAIFGLRRKGAHA